jgi:hypothetical protein
MMCTTIVQNNVNYILVNTKITNVRLRGLFTILMSTYLSRCVAFNQGQLCIFRGTCAKSTKRSLNANTYVCMIKYVNIYVSTLT